MVNISILIEGVFYKVFIVESIARIRRMYHVDGKGIRAIARELYQKIQLRKSFAAMQLNLN